MKQPRQLFARSIDHDIADLFMKQTTEGRHHRIGFVHSVYQNVMNIMTINNNQLFSIGNNQVFRAPYMINIAENIDFRKALARQNHSKQIRINGNKLLIENNLEIHLDKAERWSTSIDRFSSFNDIYLCKVLQQITYLVDQKGTAGGLKEVWLHYQGRQSSSILTIYEKGLDVQLQYLVQSMNGCNNEHIYLSCKNFVGLGIGLTPSGDDFLAGWLLTLYAFKHPIVETFQKHRTDWLNFIRARTTVVSYFMLEAALKGKGNEAMQELFIGIKTEQNVKHAIDQLLSIGSSSGTDMLAGVGCALAMIIK